jgi:hypothetical protein
MRRIHRHDSTVAHLHSVIRWRWLTNSSSLPYGANESNAKHRNVLKKIVLPVIAAVQDVPRKLAPGHFRITSRTEFARKSGFYGHAGRAQRHRVFLTPAIGEKTKHRINKMIDPLGLGMP